MGNQMTALRLIMLAMLLLVGDIVAVYGQAPSALPPGMTQDQFDSMVDAMGKALVVKLRSEGALPAPVPATAPPQAAVAGNLVAYSLTAFLENADHVLPPLPTLCTYLTSPPHHL